MRIILVTAMLVAIALSGCASDEPTTSDGSTSSSSESTPEDTTTMENVYAVNITANQTKGDIPIAIGFDVELFVLNVISNETFYDPYDGNYTYTVYFEDGNETTGEGQGDYFFVENTYELGGTYNPNAAVSFDGQLVTGNTTIVVTTPPPPRQLPEVTEFAFGPSAGCAGDLETCIGIILVTMADFTPEDATGYDGHWAALGEAYWGLKLTSTITPGLPDSDCSFYGADFVSVGSANNGEQECDGTIPVNAEWIYIYGYAQPSTAITMTVSF
jgi:hypothetical protein